MMRNFPLPSRLARTGCSVLALATALVVGPSPAAAQSFLATGSPNNGAGTTIAHGPGTTTISVTAPQTVIDWVPTDNATNNNVPIVFQSSGTTASFLGTGNFAVLNNVTATDLSRVISMNGTITAGALGAAAAANGSIYFYSPSGILLGGTSMINVGSLVLSASPIAFDGSDTFITGASNQVIFGQALRATAAITTSAGSAINATGGDAYVAMVAPRVEHGGSINVNGSAALVGAEAATINFSPDGLFDIQVTAGTTDANGVYNNGNITGSASTGIGDIHRAYLVAVPKNAALTMLITTGSDLGFSVAGAANVVGNTVVLSAGHDISDGAIAGVSAGSTASAIANLDIRDTNFTSALVGEATGFAHLEAFSILTFRSDATVHADGEIWFSTQTAVGAIDVDGNLALSTERYALNGQSMTTSLIDVYNANGAGSINVDGSTTLNTNAHGGWSGEPLSAGNATAGSITVQAAGGGSIDLLGGLTASANGTAGDVFVAGGDGGIGRGGDITVQTIGNNSALNIVGGATLTANGYGGSGTGGECFACDGDGGDGYGGDIDIIGGDGTGATLNMSGNVMAVADGFGGAAQAATAVAGIGYGGESAFYVGTGNSMTVTGTLLLQAEGNGGNHSGGNGGAGFGGEAAITETLTATSGTIVINGNVELSSDGQGGNSFGVGASGGNGTGGGTIGSSYILADTASTTINGDVNLHSTGTGGFSSNGTGGVGFGGDSRLTSNSLLTITGAVDVTAEGVGGDGVTGGNATGGEVRIRALMGGDLNLFGASNSISTNASGGEGTNGNGGSAVSGDITRIYADGVASTVTISGATTVTANATGGSSGSGAGGLGDGGVAAVSALGGGTIIFDDDVLLSASATGGNTASGIGGDALGGTARLVTDNGTIQINGNLSLNGSATGGMGNTGGNATALVSPLTNESLPVAVALYASNGGSISVDGQATLNGSAVGGAGSNGNGGNAAGGEADVVPFVGDIGLGSLSVDVTARGGNGGNGGSGGIGQGGSVDVAFGLGSAPINATITLGSATVMADGYGGNGGAGINDNFGGDGGAGGAGLGGSLSFVGSAAGGTLDSGPALLTAHGTGGQGGAGGNGDSGTGGDGGSGGNGTGGTIQTGTISNTNSPGSGGGAAYSTLSIDTSAAGGNGGGGGSGGGGNGAGGNGGDATGGRSSFLIRGVLGTADSVSLIASAIGGNGGLGSTDGDGGDARTGVITVESKDRFDVPTERGTLIVSSIIGSAIAIGGSGATAGTSTVVDGSSFRLINGDATIGSVAITLSGNLIDSTLGPSYVSVRDGAASIGTFSFVTDGTLSLDANNGAMNAGSITLTADNFVPHIANPVPTNLGTYFANSFDIQTGNNFITTAHLDSVATLSIVAPRAIQIGNVTGDNMIILNAQGAEVDIGNVLAGGGIDIDAADFISTGNLSGNGVIDLDAGLSIGTGSIINTGNTSLNAGTSINVGAINSGLGSVSLVTNNNGDISGSIVVGGSIYADSDGSIFLGNLTASGDVELVAIGDILVGNALAGETIDLDAGGYIDGGTMTAGDSVYVQAGDYVDLLDISAGIVDPSSGYDADYNVGILAGTTIDTGDIAAANSIGLGAAGNIFTGTIDAGNIFLALGGGGMSFGTINADNFTYLADDSMIPLGGDLSEEGGFDPAPILAATPTVSGGSITLRGPVITGRFVAAAGTTLTGTTIAADTSIYTSSGGNTTLTDLDAGSSIFQRSGAVITENDLDAGSYIDIRSTGGLALGDLVAGDYIDLRSNAAIGLGNASSGETINFLTGSTVTGGSMTAGNSVLAEATGAIQLAAITAGITDPSTSPTAEYAARFSSGGAITIGNVNAVGRIGFATPTNLVTGNLSSGAGLLALVGGNMTAGAINASDYVYLANHSMAALGGPFATFDRAPILALVPVATGGSITLEAVNTGRFQAAAGTTLTGTTINSNGLLYATSGGTMTLGNLFADNDVRLTSGGNITTGTIYSYDDVALVAAGSISTLDIFAYDDVSADAGTTISTDDITGNSINLFAGGDITTGDLLTQNFFLGQAAPPLVPGSSVSVVSAADIDVGNIDALDGVHVSADGSITAGTIVADTFVQLYADGAITAGNINVGTTIDTLSGGSQSLANLTAGDWIELDSEGAIIFGNVIAEGFDFTSGGAVTGGNINALSYAIGEAEGAIVLGNITTTGAPPVDDFSIGFASATSILVGNAIGTDRVGFATLGNLTTGNITAGSLFMALVGGNMVAGSITTANNGQVYIADGSMYATGGGTGDGDFDSAIVLALNPVPTGGSITINGPVTTGQFQAAAGTTFNVGTIVANGRVALSSGGAMLTQAVTAGTSLRMTSGSTINGGNLTAGTLVRVSAAAAVNVGNITITNNISSAAPEGDAVFDVFTGQPIEVFGASIATGNISTDGYVGLYTPGDLSVGTIDAGHDVIALVGDDAAFGAITTPERFFLGGYQMFALVTGGEGFSPGAAFDAQQKSSTGGSASFAGSSSTASFEAYVGDDTTLASLDTVDGAQIDTGGLFTLTGSINGESRIISNDIDIGVNALINDDVELISRNASQTLIGDGLDALGAGYRLSDSEADRLKADFDISADSSYGAAPKMIIGELSITANGSSESELEYDFETTDGDSDNPSVGSIKVVGDVVFTGLGQFDEVNFDTNVFQLDAATGSISLFSTGTTLGGTLGLFAPRIWVASGAILAKLEANATYSGYLAELNAPAAVQRPEGVLRAGLIDIDTGGEALQSLLVQNTGTTALPAGFLTGTAEIDGEEDFELAPASVNLVINGQLITESGTISGLAVRDLLVTEFGSTAFVAGSTINGCVLVGPCTATPPPTPRVDTPTRTDIPLSDNGGLGDGLFGNEGDIDDGESGDGGDRSSPISPPNPLFDSRPLTQSGDVDDPVSGAGNPSLYGSPDDEDEGDDEDMTKKAKAKQGDGK